MSHPLDLKPAKTLHGYVDDSTYYTLLGDVLEHVGDMQYPASVPILARMRRDPQLAAVLKAYTLPISRATWSVDPSGCDPGVAARVADDLGIAVSGKDVPGSARVRGVSWREHLRGALLALVYGHYGYAMAAEIREGRARLTVLSPRPPHTISNIRVDGTTGELLGVDQDARVSNSSPPQIPARELVWYTNEREGANWQGVSLLRPAYAPWLLKMEAMRILATSSRRFGMGVPTVEWESGSNPTPAQMQQAQALASAARVGDTAGAALPPGARLALIGLTGSAPPTLDFVKWLDSQMSRMALAGHLDLGQTETGSRALGEAFVDLLMLAEQSIGDDLADAATRQVTARLVAWNEGESEPVPRVDCGDVGAKHDVTAESIKLLLDSKALTPDPGLEAFLRRKYRLPEREGMTQPAPSVRGDTVSAANKHKRSKRNRRAGR